MSRYIYADGRLALGAAAPATAHNPAKDFSHPVHKLIAKAGHFRKSGDLFSGPPTIADVRQALIGDCFLLASVAAILAQAGGPDYLLGMMRDQGDGTVVVRFYNDTTPQLVRVPKSVLGPGMHNRGALWLQLLEKAYASFRGGYSKVATGGKPNLALEALLGRDSFTFEFAQQGRSPDRELLDRCLTYTARQGELGKRPIVAHVFDGSEAHWTHWSTWLRTNDIPTRWPTCIASKIMVRREHFEAFMDQYAETLDRDTRSQFMRWVYLNQVLPGKRGTGDYTRAEQQTYADIQRALASGRAVAVSTEKFMTLGEAERKDGGRGHSAGESKYKGIVGTHAYAVIRCEPRDGLQGLVIRNPWGKTRMMGYGRRYTGTTPGNMSAKTTSDAEFWVELSDVSKYFTNVHIGGTVGAVA